jgi:hypothetical protein
MIVDARCLDSRSRCPAPSRACPRPAVKFALTNATSAFDDLSRPRYQKLWRISVIPLDVGFLFRIDTRYPNVHGTWHRAAGRQRSQRHWQLLPLVSAVVLPIKSSRRTCTRSSCVKNARNVASALRPLPNSAVLFVMELLQSLGKAHANERRQPRRNPSQQRKIDLPSHASAWQTIGDPGDTECHARDVCFPVLRSQQVVVLDFPIARSASLVTLTVSATPAVKVAAATA